MAPFQQAQQGQVEDDRHLHPCEAPGAGQDQPLFQIDPRRSQFTAHHLVFSHVRQQHGLMVWVGDGPRHAQRLLMQSQRLGQMPLVILKQAQPVQAADDGAGAAHLALQRQRLFLIGAGQVEAAQQFVDRGQIAQHGGYGGQIVARALDVQNLARVALAQFQLLAPVVDGGDVAQGNRHLAAVGGVAQLLL